MRWLNITALGFEVCHLLETGKGLQRKMDLSKAKWVEIID